MRLFTQPLTTPADVGTFTYLWSVDDPTFRLNYVHPVTGAGDGFTFATLADHDVKNGWQVQFWNQRTMVWDVVYTTSGTPTRVDGWSIFEPWYAPDTPCPKALPNFNVTNLRYVDDTSSTWRLVSSAVKRFHVSVNYGKRRAPPGFESPLPQEADCFNGDQSGAASYRLQISPAGNYFNWSVESSGS
jgi:hypothetical protein